MLEPDLDPVAAAGPRRDGYRLSYALSGPPGGYALQRVETEICYLSGEQTVLHYLGLYYEFFRFARDGQLGQLDAGSQADHHAFGLREDGWTPGDLRRLTRELGIALPLWSEGPTRIRCRKHFRLGLGRVEGETSLSSTPDGGEFGYLAAGAGERSAASLQLVTAGTRTPLRACSALPSGRAEQGEGWFLEAQGWRAEEVLTCTLATVRSTFDSGGGYRRCGLEADLGQ